MARDLILGQLLPDLACAIALGFVEDPRVTITLDAITLADPRTRMTRTQNDWLSAADPLDLLTRQYLSARLEAMKSVLRPGMPPWDRTRLIKAREVATSLALQAKTQAGQLLEDRGVLIAARKLGLKVNEAA